MLTETDADLIGRPSIVQPYCCICGRSPVEQHHVVPRSRTVKRKDRGPTVSLCKRCHTEHHSKRPLRWTYDDGWLADGKRVTTRDVDPA